MKIGDFKRGWFLGKFQPSLAQTDYEVGLRFNEYGEKEDRHYHKGITEYVFFAGGEHRLNDRTYGDGDGLVISPYMSTDYECLAPGYCLTVKDKSIPGDKYPGRPLNIVIPMAGKGQRFKDAGYEIPKAMIPIQGQPMINRVVDNLKSRRDNRVLLVSRQEIDPDIPNAQVIKLDHDTNGAVSTMLEVEHLIGRDDPLLIANCDQLLLNFDADKFMEASADCSVTVFSSDVPHHSYVKLGEDGNVTEVAEKRVISDLAVGGVYYFRKAKYYFDAAHKLIDNDLRVNGEFYNTPVFSQLPPDLKVNTYKIKHENQIILGTPFELEQFQTLVDKGVVEL